MNRPETFKQFNNLDYAQAEQSEILTLIDVINKLGNYGILADAVIYLLLILKKEHQDALITTSKIIAEEELLKPDFKLISVVIDKKFAFKLPGLGDIELKMYPVTKALYILFLKHQDGIRFKNMMEYKTELLSIYSLLTRKGDKNEIEKIVNNLLNVYNPNLNIQCSRIRAIFRAIMPEEMAKNYYITGNSGEPKKVLLPRNLVKFEENNN